MAPKVPVADLLASTSLFGKLDVADRQLVAARMRPVEFDAGQMIFSRGDEGRDVYLVLDGRVKLSILSAEGRELSFHHALAGSVFGEIAALDGGQRTADATALTAVKGMLLPAAALNAIIETNARVAKAAIAFLCERLRETDQNMTAIALDRIELRLARFLVLQLRRTPGAGDKDKVAIDLGMSQGELALLIGASRPKVNAALAALEETGVISRDGAKIVCDVEALEDYAALD